VIEGKLVAISHSTERWGSGDVQHTTTEHLDNHTHRLTKAWLKPDGRMAGYSMFGDGRNGADWGYQWGNPFDQMSDT
jgi:hypothetical protein